jgi:hypothetical protein
METPVVTSLTNNPVPQALKARFVCFSHQSLNLANGST